MRKYTTFFFFSTNNIDISLRLWSETRLVGTSYRLKTHGLEPHCHLRIHFFRRPDALAGSFGAMSPLCEFHLYQFYGPLSLGIRHFYKTFANSFF